MSSTCRIMRRSDAVILCLPLRLISLMIILGLETRLPVKVVMTYRSGMIQNLLWLRGTWQQKMTRLPKSKDIILRNMIRNQERNLHAMLPLLYRQFCIKQLLVPLYMKSQQSSALVLVPPPAAPYMTPKCHRCHQIYIPVSSERLCDWPWTCIAPNYPPYLLH